MRFVNLPPPFLCITCDRGDFFVGEVAINCKVDHQTGAERVERVLTWVTKVLIGGDKQVKKSPPEVRKVFGADFLVFRRREKVLSAEVLTTRKLFVPRHRTVDMRAQEPWYSKYLVRPTDGSRLSTSDDHSNMLLLCALLEKENIL